MVNKHYDIVIIGGGLVGSSLALALANTKCSIAIVEPFVAKTLHPSFDSKTIVLSESTVRFFKSLDLWEYIAPFSTAISQIHVSNKGRFGAVRFHAQDVSLKAFGYVIKPIELGVLFHKSIQTAENIDFLCPKELVDFDFSGHVYSLQLKGGEENLTVSCDCLVGADGVHSRVRNLLEIKADIYDYQQTIFSSNVRVAAPILHVAYERFFRGGALALLPVGQSDYTAILTVSNQKAESIKQMSEGDYLQYLESILGLRLGRMTKTSARQVYPAMQLLANYVVDKQAVLLGNSAHQFHPIGAQGFNLAVRDVALLAEYLLEGFSNHTLSMALQNYQTSRSDATTAIKDYIQWIAYGADLHTPPLQKLFTLGLNAMSHIPVIREHFVKKGAGMADCRAKLLRGIPLS